MLPSHVALRRMWNLEFWGTGIGGLPMVMRGLIRYSVAMYPVNVSLVTYAWWDRRNIRDSIIWGLTWGTISWIPGVGGTMTFLISGFYNLVKSIG